ncbi:MAG TPA: endonuclease domain-containing protein [Blastococcus sp.]
MPVAQNGLAAQNGLCAICKAAPAAHVDHETGDMRALLCFNGNGGLGQFKDDRYLRHVAAFYVEHHRVRQALRALSDAAHTGPRGPAARGSRR